MVVDSSAISAVLFEETDAEKFIYALAAPERKFMSAMNRLETAIVVEARKGEAGAKALAECMVLSEIEVIPFDSGQAEIALAAWRRFGKGRHPAALNLGDCAAYALASVMNEPLLFKGDDFSKTDVAEA
ncbi:MAG: type II toxin-antitoxin system VapC family toxin [Treponemataceae bacterium]